MGKLSGADVLVSVNTGSQQSPSWTEIGGQRSATINMQADTIDTSDKTTGGFKTFMAGLIEWSVEMDALYVENDNGMSALHDAFIARAMVEIVVTFDGVTRYTGYAYVTELSSDAAHDDAVTMKCTLSGASALTVN